MKIVVTAYTFDKTARTVTLTDYSSVTQERIMLVANVSAETVIYNWAATGRGGTVSGNVLTLEYDTSAMNNADKLLIVYDDPAAAMSTAGTSLAVPFSTTTAQAVATTDVSNYRGVSVQIVTQGSSSTVAFQGSNDNVNWVPLVFQRTNDTGTLTPVASTTTSGISGTYFQTLNMKYFRLNVTGITSGTTAGTVLFHTLPAGSAYSVGVAGGVNVSNFSQSIGGSDAVSPSASPAVGAYPYAWNGVSWDRVRTPVKYKSATATASGDTAVWTPAAGKRFRLLRYQVQVTANAATASGGTLDVVLRDASTDIGLGYSQYVPSVAGTTFAASGNSGWADLGSVGYLSTGINQALNVNLSAALTSGHIRVVACGTEE